MRAGWVELFEKCSETYPHHNAIGLKGFGYGLAGRCEDARAVLTLLSEMARIAYVSPRSFAFVYQGLGEIERWKSMMQASLEERNGRLPVMDAPWNDGVRHDPFFAELRRKVGLP